MVEYIRQMQAECKDLKTAIDTAVKACISEGFEGFIEDFLMKHSREVTGMLFRELTMEEFAEIRARESFAKGEKEGLERSAAQKQREIAKNMKAKNLDLKTIFEITGLPLDEIETL